MKPKKSLVHCLLVPGNFNLHFVTKSTFFWQWNRVECHCYHVIQQDKPGNVTSCCSFQKPCFLHLAQNISWSPLFPCVCHLRKNRKSGPYKIRLPILFIRNLQWSTNRQPTTNLTIAAQNAFEAVRNYQNTPCVLHCQVNINSVEANELPFVLKL